jgi:hypothetical protein
VLTPTEAAKAAVVEAENEGDESDSPVEGMWKFCPEWAERPDVFESMEDSTDGKAWRSGISGGGGVSACWSGEAW